MRSSASSTDTSWSTHVMSSRGTITSRSGRSPKSSAPDNRSCAVCSINPSSRDSASIRLISSAVCALISSSRGSTPNSRVPALLIVWISRVAGRNTVTYSRLKIDRRDNIRSGSASARYRGTISPNTMCRNATIPRPTTTASTSATPSGTDSGDSTTSSRRTTEGSATAPRPSEHMVTPSCDDASCNGRSRDDCSADRAWTSPSAASVSSRVRRLATSENSLATNNPLSTSNTTASNKNAAITTGSPATPRPAIARRAWRNVRARAR